MFSGKRKENDFGPGTEKEKYYSAELSFAGLGTPYQFKIRRDPCRPLSVLVREDSDLVPLLQVGDVVSVKYYFEKPNYAPRCLDTAIRDITKNDQGRFRGHYQVDLEILNDPEQGNSCLI
jgi:hypothetical protein